MSICPVPPQYPYIAITLHCLPATGKSHRPAGESHRLPDLVCQKARLIVNDPSAGTSFAPSESSFGNRDTNTRASQAGYSRAGSGGQSATRGARGLDVMQVQKIMARNPELADVVSLVCRV
jgi:hypothetical protein